MTSIARRSLVPSIAITLALWLVPSALAKPAGQLDPSFGKGGVAITQNRHVAKRFWDGTGVQVARGADGTIYVLADYNGQPSTVIAFDANGAIDREFGSNGRISIGEFAGLPFKIEAIATDPSGRLIVAGAKTEFGASSGPVSELMVMRFLPDGAPDPSFGGAGATSALGYFSTGGGFGTRALAAVESVAVAPSGQIVVFSHSFHGGQTCTLSSASVVRFEEDGRLDQSFGRGGYVLLSGQGELAAPGATAIGPEGSIELAGNSATCVTPGTNEALVGHLTRLTPSGQVDPTFGGAGFVALSPDPEAIAVDGSGRTVVLGAEGVLRRFTSTGAPDPSFGTNGVDDLVGTREATALAVTEGGMVVAAGGRTIELLDAKGRPVRGFGRKGIATPAVGKLGETVPTSVVVDGQGHALLAGPLTSPAKPKVAAGVGLFSYDLGG